jgi:MinD-like ATPase involved in chromosome partitioning or flagellar assembly
MTEGSDSEQEAAGARPVPLDVLRAAALAPSDDAATPSRMPQALVRRRRTGSDPDLGSAASRPLQPGQRAVVISISGGVGRTTVAACLGHTLAAARPGRALLLDGASEPFRGFGSRVVGVDCATTVDALASDDLDKPAVVAKLLRRDDETGLWVLPGPRRDQALVGPRQLGRLVGLLGPQVDALVVDCQAGAGEIFAPYAGGGAVVVAVTRAQEADVIALAGALGVLSARGVERRRVVCVVNHGAAADRGRSLRAAMTSLTAVSSSVVEIAADRALARSTRVRWSAASGRTKYSAGQLARACVNHWVSGVARP